MPNREPPIEVVETEWIELPDRPRLAARLWLPADALNTPVPAVFEFLPYRRRDGTAARDESTYPVFARAGYAGVRVDMRGTGDSDGVYDDEYSETEVGDAEAVIAWIAEQPWCSGAVGMMGISWGGFNALQVAARRPPALKAVISIASSVDRYNDDIHYRNGCHLGAHLNWAATVMAYMSRPPDSDVVGERWRQMWQERLEALEPPSLTWVAHQRRDEFWKRGSLCEDFDAVQAPVLVIAGWGDGYRNTPMKALAGLTAPTKALVGPWIHKYPHFALPRPRVDFHLEAIRWWDHWLRGIDNGVEELPRQRAFIAEAVRPADQSERVRGRWVARDPDADDTHLRLYLTPARTLSASPQPGQLIVDTPETCGAGGGVFFVVDPTTELPLDQRTDDELAVVFETPPLDTPLDVLGRTRLSLRVALDQPQGNLIARLEDVHPDGSAHRVAIGMLNLSHRHSNETLRPMEPGELEPVELLLDDAGYRFMAGHRVRVALSTTYFPLVLPPPAHVRATIAVGDDTYVDIPTPTNLVAVELPEPADDLLPVYQQLSPGSADRVILRAGDGSTVTTTILSDTGELVHPTNGMVWREIHESRSSITADDPSSFECVEVVTVMRRRSAMETLCSATCRLTATATAWQIEAQLTAFENGSGAFERSWRREIERDHQ